MAERQVSVAHNPIRKMRLKSGVAPVRARASGAARMATGGNFAHHKVAQEHRHAGWAQLKPRQRLRPPRPAQNSNPAGRFVLGSGRPCTSFNYPD